MRFVLLEHDSPAGLHWDFMLAVDATGPLKTWRLAANPLETRGSIDATPIGDHRREYLAYEGPVSGGRGSVARRDEGSAVIAMRDASRVELELGGRRLRGKFTLETTDAGTRFRRAP